MRREVPNLHMLTWVAIALFIAAAAVRLLVPFRLGLDLPLIGRVVSLNFIVFWLIVAVGGAILVADIVVRLTAAVHFK